MASYRVCQRKMHASIWVIKLYVCCPLEGPLLCAWSLTGVSVKMTGGHDIRPGN